MKKSCDAVHPECGVYHKDGHEVPDPIEDLLAYLQRLPDNSGTVCFQADAFLPVHFENDQEFGYAARCTVGGALFVGRALSLDEACSILRKKLEAKYPLIK